MSNIINNACEEIDAAFFSGDSFHDEEEVKKIKVYLDRWNREVKAIERSLEEERLKEND